MEKINVAELLKDCPSGMELDCTICNNVVTLEGVDKEGYYPIIVMTKSGYHHRLTCEGYVYEEEDAKCVIYPKGKTTWEGFQIPFKDGDILYVKAAFDWICIYKESEDTENIYKYVAVLRQPNATGIVKDINCLCCRGDISEIRLATEEEKQKLFKAIKDYGYKWNEESKTLEKLVTDKFDINTLKPFDKVLVRDSYKNMWCASIFSHTWKDKYFCIGSWYNQCIPYEANKELLGTTNDCGSFYKNWEEE